MIELKVFKDSADNFIYCVYAQGLPVGGYVQGSGEDCPSDKDFEKIFKLNGSSDLTPYQTAKFTLGKTPLYTINQLGKKQYNKNYTPNCEVETSFINEVKKASSYFIKDSYANV